MILPPSEIQKGEKVPVVDFKNGRPITCKGVVPVIEGKLDWVFLNKTKNEWEPITNDEAPKVQFAAYGSPLTKKRIQKFSTIRLGRIRVGRL
jgi:hypothetical protein